jgi:hypothetical protein
LYSLVGVRRNLAATTTCCTYSTDKQGQTEDRQRTDCGQTGDRQGTNWGPTGDQCHVLYQSERAQLMSTASLRATSQRTSHTSPGQICCKSAN